MGTDLITVPSNYWFWYHGFQQADGSATADLYSLVHGNWDNTGPWFMKQYWVFKKLFSTVRPGWQVKQVSTDDVDIKGEPETTADAWGGGRVRTFALEDSSGTASMVVFINDTGSAKSFNVGGLKGSWANVFVSDSYSDTSAKQAIQVSNGTANGVSVPAYSVVLVETTSNGVTHEVWNNISGTSLSSVNWGSAPSTTTKLTTLESLSDVADNFGERIRGYITAPVSGTYYFWVTGDDDFQFNISSNDSPTNLGSIEANTQGWTPRQQWDNGSARSFTFNMTAGSKYYFEAFHKEGSGGDNFAVAWTRPDQYKQLSGSTENPTWPREIVPATVLTPYGGSQPGPNLISNSDFEAEQYGTQTPSAWSEWSSIGGVGAGYTENYGGSKSGSYHGTHWSGNAYNMYTYQTKTSLANGLYTLRAWVKSGGGQKTCQLEAKDFGGTTRSVAITANNNYYQVEIKDINVTNGQCTIGFWSDANGGNWVYFDDVEFFKQ